RNSKLEIRKWTTAIREITAVADAAALELLISSFDLPISSFEFRVSTMEADLKTLQIDRSGKRPPEPSKWAVRWIVGGVALFGLLGISPITDNKLNARIAVQTDRVTSGSAGAAGTPGVVRNAIDYI